MWYYCSDKETDVMFLQCPQKDTHIYGNLVLVKASTITKGGKGRIIFKC